MVKIYSRVLRKKKTLKCRRDVLLMYNRFQYTVVKYDKEYKEVARYENCTYDEVRKLTKGYKDIDGHGFIFERKNSPYFFNVYC